MNAFYARLAAGRQACRLLLFLFVVFDAAVFLHRRNQIGGIELKALVAFLIESTITRRVFALGKLLFRWRLLIEHIQHCTIAIRKDGSADLIFPQIEGHRWRSAHDSQLRNLTLLGDKVAELILR